MYIYRCMDTLKHAHAHIFILLRLLLEHSKIQCVCMYSMYYDVKSNVAQNDSTAKPQKQIRRHRALKSDRLISILLFLSFSFCIAIVFLLLASHFINGNAMSRLCKYVCMYIICDMMCVRCAQKGMNDPKKKLKR